MYNIILIWARIFLRLYFHRIIVYGQEKVPAKGPLIVASNHPSAFMEASVLATVVGRQVHFMVRGDVFNPKFHWLFKWTNQIPIYRQKDGISNLRKNASSFDLTYRKLSEGNAVLIFPEAKTTLEKKMRPIQRGTAHLAFGTLPLIKPGSPLQVIPVGVNFTNPRIPGTDVLVQFGEAYLSMDGMREDREAIEEFTAHLSSVLHPLIVEVTDIKDEPLYDVLASVYYCYFRSTRKRVDVLNDLKKIAVVINHPEKQPELFEKLKLHVKLLRKEKMVDGLYFPRLLAMNKLFVFIILLLKTIWFVGGGFVWRFTRQFIFKKLRTETFQGPTSVGAAMVIIPLFSLIVLGLLLILGLPVWWLFVWLAMLGLGKLIPYPLALIWRVMITFNANMNVLQKGIGVFKKAVGKIIAPV